MGLHYDSKIDLDYSQTVKTDTLGYLYTNTGMDTRDMTPELPELDAHTLGTGLGYQLSEKLKLVCSLGP